MDKRVAELRERLWKKKAALQQKANLPVPTKSQALQPCGPSRVAAVGPYILSSTAAPGPPVPSRQELLIKPAYPDGTITLPMPDSSMKAPPRPLKPYPAPTGFQSSKTSQLSDWSSSRAESSGSHHGMSSTLPRMSSLSSQGSGDAETLKDQKGRHISMFDAPAPVHSQNNPSSEDLLRDTQAGGKALGKVPPPIPTKPRPSANRPTARAPSRARQNRPPPSICVHLRPSTATPCLCHPSRRLLRRLRCTPSPRILQSSTAAVPVLQKLQTVAASSIYSMYTQQPRTGGGTLTRTQPRVISGSGGQQSLLQDSIWGPAISRWTRGVPAWRLWHLRASGARRRSGPLVPSAPPSSSPSSRTLTGTPATPTWKPCTVGCTMPRDPSRRAAPSQSLRAPRGPTSRSFSTRRPHWPPWRLVWRLPTRVKVEEHGRRGPVPVEPQTALVRPKFSPLQRPSLRPRKMHRCPPARPSQSPLPPPATPCPRCWRKRSQIPATRPPHQPEAYLEEYPPPSIPQRRGAGPGGGHPQHEGSGGHGTGDSASGVQEKMGIMNRGVVYALWDYEAEVDDELAFQEGNCMTVLRREDKDEIEWWWARCGDREGYIPRNLLGLYLRIKPRQRSLA